MIKLVSTMLLAVTACSTTPYPQQPTHNDPRKVVVYEVGGNVDYASYDDNLQSGIQYPVGRYRIELRGNDVPQPPKGLYTWANSSEGRDSKAWCRITVDGKVVAENHTEGSANDPMCLVP